MEKLLLVTRADGTKTLETARALRGISRKIHHIYWVGDSRRRAAELLLKMDPRDSIETLDLMIITHLRDYASRALVVVPNIFPALRILQEMVPEPLFKKSKTWLLDPMPNLPRKKAWIQEPRRKDPQRYVKGLAGEVRELPAFGCEFLYYRNPRPSLFRLRLVKTGRPLP